MAAGRVCDGDAVDDIVQQAFLRAIKARDQGVHHALKAILFNTARNLAVDYLRKKRIPEGESSKKLESSNVIQFSESIPEVVSRNEEYVILNRASASLPEKCREIIAMRRVYGRSQMEIADALGISRNTVSAQLTIGLRKCSEYFERYDEEGEDVDVVR